MRKVIAIILTTIALLVSLPTLASATTIEPCIHEDGSGQTTCYWDGDTRGNGQGLSYVIDNGETIYGFDPAIELTQPVEQPAVEAPATYTVTTYEAPVDPTYTTTAAPAVEQPAAAAAATVVEQPAADQSAAAWELFDNTNASDLLPNINTTVTYTASGSAAFTLSADTITVWDNNGNHHLFTITTN